MRAISVSVRQVNTGVFSFVLLIGLLLATQAHSATLAENEAKFDRMYEQMMADPADVDLALEYAELAVEIGDYEAAIPPMERLLLQNPDATKLKLELGVLYYLLGSYDMSKNYLTEVTQDAGADGEMKAQANSFLSRM